MKHKANTRPAGKSAPAKIATHRHGALRRVILNTVKAHTPLTAGLAGAVAGSVLFTLVPPLVLERIIDQLVMGRGVAPAMALLYFGTLALSGLFDAGKEMLITIFGQKITHGLRSDMCEKLSRLQAGYFTKNETGTITSRMVNDVDTMESLFANGIIGMGVDACKVLGIVAVVFVKSKGLGILLLIIAPLISVMTRGFQKRMLKAQKENRVAIGRVNQYIPETIGNIRTIHCLVKERYMEQRYDKKIQDSYRAVEKSNLYDSVYSPIIIMISTGVTALVMVLSAMGGGMQALFGMSVGTAVAIIAYVGKVFKPIESIGMEIQNIQSAVAGVSRIEELLSDKEAPKTDAAITFEKLMQGQGQGIALSDVDFAYDGKHKIIKNLSFTVNTGEMVALAGRTGAGKSTIFKLLLGLYRPQKGSVCIFGQEASRIPVEEKRKLFGYVEQSFHMVPGTVADQISLYSEGISPQAVQNAARLVGLHEAVMALPEQYETDCASAKFSQGQLQLLSIARAVAANPPILLLDEITANLDSITQREVLTALECASEGRTVISISHRLYENLGNHMHPVRRLCDYNGTTAVGNGLQLMVMSRDI